MNNAPFFSITAVTAHYKLHAKVKAPSNFTRTDDEGYYERDVSNRFKNQLPAWPTGDTMSSFSLLFEALTDRIRHAPMYPKRWGKDRSNTNKSNKRFGSELLLGQRKETFNSPNNNGSAEECSSVVHHRLADDDEAIYSTINVDDDEVVYENAMSVKKYTKR
jgi:hypothetical protein